MVVKQISSLEKVRKNSDMCFDEICKAKILRDERFFYQIAMKSRTMVLGTLEVESVLKKNINGVFGSWLVSGGGISMEL